VSAAHVVAAVAAVVLAAGAIWLRRKGRLSGERFLLALVAAAALGIYASGVLGNLPNAEHLITDLAETLGAGTYALVGALAFLETGAFVGLVAPGEFTVIVGGVIAGEGTIDIVPLIGLTWFCCIAGDTTSFFIGRKLGRSFLERHGPKVKITHERLSQVEGYFDRHGGKTILIGRFVGLVRALAPFVAGSSGMPYRRFIPFSILGTGLWSTFFLLLGYFFYQSFDKVAAIAGRATLVFGFLVGAIVLIVWSYRQLRDDEKRARFVAWVDRQSRRPLLRPFAAVARWLWRAILRPLWMVVAPPVRFFWDRLLPGDLGLQLTTAVAVAGVGLYVFVAYIVVVSGNPGPTGFDDRVFDMARDLRLDIGVDAAKILTVFGSLPVVGGFVLVSAAVLAWKRQPIELVGLVVSLILIYVAVHVTKGALDRPRPPDPLAGSIGSAYPSGHAAYSTAYVAMAVIASRVLGGIFARGAFVLLAVAFAAAIGGTRVVLQVHWWSDVTGGWGLGAAIFGSVAVVGLFVGYFRHNDPSPATAERPERAAPEHV
jgi:membrane protein DedA with SNARE-associated domain